jgi:hypothetical protein
MFKFKPEIGQAQQGDITKEIAEALGQIPTVKKLTIGPAFNEDTRQACDLGLFLDFEDEPGLNVYIDHPLHKGIAAKVPGLCSEVKVLDFSF